MLPRTSGQFRRSAASRRRYMFIPSRRVAARFPTISRLHRRFCYLFRLPRLARRKSSPMAGVPRARQRHFTKRALLFAGCHERDDITLYFAARGHALPMRRAPPAAYYDRETD